MYCQRCGTQVTDAASFCSSCGLDVTSIGGAPPPSAEEAADEIVAVREALKGEYDIIKELGRGGMAIVYRAHDKELDREVAIKVLPASMGFDAEFVERFQREAKTAAKLEHPSIIPIYRVGKAGRVIYFVMKFLRGKSLADLVDDHGRLDPTELRRLLSETASALGYAHKNGIVHRDIKPDNILLDDTGRAIVTDFGIAKAATAARLTGTGMAIGTPHYMSPEQARATPLDGRSDIYSLGVCAYQCLTGHVPFDGTDAFSIGYKHITEPTPRPELENEEQRSLFPIIEKMMAKDPNERYQTAEELCFALDARGTSMAPQTISTRPTTPIRASAAKKLLEAAEMAISATPTTPMPKTDLMPPHASAKAAPKKKKSRGGVLVAAAALVVLVGGGGGGYYYYTNIFDRGTLPVVSPNLPTPATDGPTANSSEPTGQTPVGAVPGDSANVAGQTDTTTAADDTVATEPAPPTTGVLALSGMPRTARVSVDGNNMSGVSYDLTPGSHRLLVTAAGREDFSRTVEISVGDTTALVVAMDRVQRAEPTPPVRAQANCTSPGANFNAGNACYDVAPAPLDAPLVTLTDAIQGTPASVVVFVQISVAGQALNVSPIGAPADPEFFGLAVTRALEMSYNPAQKNGLAVEGWFQLELIPMPR